MTTVVFSGHMLDAPGRRPARFPAGHVPRVQASIGASVARLTDPGATAYSGAACGGDLLFCEEWLATGRELTVFLPRDRENFLAESVRFAGARWERAFADVVDDPRTTVVGPPPEVAAAADPHSLTNERMLRAALHRPPPLLGIVVWDGRVGDGPGGTGDMVAAIRQAGGEVTVIPP